MHRRTRLALAGLAAAALMALAVGSASANRLSVTSQTFRATWTSLAFIGEGAPELNVRCPVTLEGSFHSRTIVKSLGSLIGHIYRAAPGTCTGGSATFLSEALPWHITYEGFSGILPRITSIKLLVRFVAIRLETGFGACLYAESGQKARIEILLEVGGAISGFEADRVIRLTKSSGLLCPERLGLEGNGRVTQQGSTTAITIRLI